MSIERRAIHPRFYTDTMADFVKRMCAHAEEQGSSRQKVRKAAKFLERVTAPYQRLDEVFLRFAPSQLRRMDTVADTISSDKMTIIGMTLWDLYGVRWMRDWKTRNEPVPGEVEAFIRDFLHPGGDEAAAEALRAAFREGYRYHFACMLRAVFLRGEVCRAAPHGRIVWVDSDGTPYDVDGACECEPVGLAPVHRIAGRLDDFARAPAMTAVPKGGRP